MQTQPNILSLFVLMIFLLLHNLPISTADWADPPTEEPNNATDFIRTSCNATRYPDVCYDTLNGYANAVQNDPAQLASTAIYVSLGHVQDVTSRVSNISREANETGNSNNHLEAEALHDCLSNFCSAMGQMRDSMKQMWQLRANSSSSEEAFRFQMSNVQTWMSAALTDEDTCLDGFDGVADGPVKRDVCDRTEDVKKVTSNALALVNSYVNIKS